MNFKEQLQKKGVWEGLPDGLKAFAETLGENLEKIAFSDDYKSQLTELVAKAEKIGEDNEEFRNTVKEHAELISKMKEAGYTPVKASNPFEALKEAMRSADVLKSANREERKGKKVFLSLTVKAADIMLSSTNITGSNLPAPQLIPGVNSAPRNTPFIMDLVDVGAATSPTIYWIEKTGRNNGTAMVAEGALKPLSDFDLATDNTQARKIAHRFQVSDEMLEDIDFLAGEIRTEGIESLRLKLEDQILFGDGTGQNLKGITESASAFSAAELADTVEKANVADAILAGLTQLQLLNFDANGILVNPITRFKLRTLKDANGLPIIPVTADSSATFIDGISIMAKNQIPAGNVLIGDFKRSKVKILKDITVEMGYSDGDWENNRVSMRVEMRVAHYIPSVHGSAFVWDSLATIQATIEAAPAV